VNFHIREIRENELDIIHSLEEDIYDTPWSCSFFKLMAKLEKNLFLVAVNDNLIVGYTVGEVESRGIKGKAGHIMNVAVKKQFRNQGIATSLLDELERRIKRDGAEISYLEVRVSNVKAQELYKNRGYKFIRKIENYYGEEDAFVMTKKLE
jgi:ribosomal-protein-alanine N-acetyltransferase